MIKIDRLRVEYEHGFTLSQISMDIGKGEIFSIVGESGSGKTTLGKAVVGILDDNGSMDEKSKDQVIRLIRKINKNYETSFLLITHDMVLAKDLSHRRGIMYNGNLIELGEIEGIIKSPSHPYTRGLINSSVELNLYKDMWGIPESERVKSELGCSFYGRCNQRLDICREITPTLQKSPQYRNRFISCNRGGIVIFLQGKNISKGYRDENVIENINIQLLAGETISFIGEPGIGKTTLLKILGGYLEADSGEIIFEYEKADFNKLHRIKNGLQMVFQDPSTSINPNMNVLQAISEPLRLFSEVVNYKKSVIDILGDVGLSQRDHFLESKIKHLSGGQKQRISMGRSLIMEPKVLLADEPTSMLDVSSKANLLRLLKGIQNSKGFSMIIVTHDIALAVKISDRVYLLEGGNRIKEYKGMDISEII